jgi:hypothetical protein
LQGWIDQVAKFGLKRDEGEQRVKKGPKLISKALFESSKLPLVDVEAQNQTLHLVGTCPVCGHEMDKVIRRRLPDDPARASRDQSRRLDVLVYCNCATIHPDQAADRAGCGSYGWLTVTTGSAAPSVIRARTGLPEDLRWELRAERLYASRLTDMRATAEKWTAGVTSITGVFGIVALIKGPETIGTLLMPWRWIVYGLVIAAVLVALLAIGLAAAAAGGTPRIARLSGREAHTWDGWQASAAKHELIYSRRAAFAAVFAMLAAIGITWFTPNS